MAHISRRKLTDEEFNHIYSNFLKIIAKSHDKNVVHNFFWEFLTPTEKIMLSKRLMIIILLENDFSPFEISQVLKISTSTADRIGKGWDRGKYSNISSLLKREKSKIWKVIEEIADLFELPPYHVSREKFLEYKRKHH